MTLTRLRARAVALLVAVVAAIPLATTLTPAAAAPATLATPVAVAASPGFDPGNIISDAVFFNGSAMNESQVDTFLRSRVSYCVPGYTCLKDFRANTWTRSGDAQCTTYAGATNESAARIIVKVAQACGINPQALVVMLQKEQGLVTSQAPSSWAWSASMGYACPDTAPCATEYFGFYNQVYMAAWQLKRYGNSSYFNWFPVGGIANVRFHPNAACGSTPVRIANRATAALYYYTPYQPNADALAAGYGTAANPCSSYGNRNFYNYFRDWFGDPAGSAASQIDAHHARNAWLGAATSGYNQLAANGGGWVRSYTQGAITWTAETGPVVISNTFRPRFGVAGGITGTLGWPLRDASLVGGKAWIQEFQGGAISQSTGAELVVIASGDWRDYRDQYLGPTGPLGLPKDERSCVADVCRQTFENADMVSSGGQRGLEVAAITAYAQANAAMGASLALATVIGGNTPGFVQSFANGAVVSSSTGTYSVRGDIRQAFGATGGLTGHLGWPIGDATCQGAMCMQSFASGRIEQLGQTAPVALSTGIAAAYDATGGRSGVLGVPLGSTVVRADDRHVQAFANGAIAWTSATGGYPVVAPIRSAFGVLGGLSGTLGWPVSAARAESANGGGTVQAFEGGAIAVSSAGAYSLTGAIRTGFGARGGLSGAFGWPVSEARVMPVNGGGTVQAFTGGALVHRPNTGVLAITGAIRVRFGDEGGLAGSLGWPTADATPVTSGGVSGLVQGFGGGAIAYRESTGAIVLTSGPVRTAFNNTGGLGGPLGWPSGELVCATDGSCEQQFVGGIIRVTPGGVVTTIPTAAP